MPRVVQCWVSIFVVAASALVSHCDTAFAPLVLDEPLQGSTLGKRSGGAFVAGVWQVTGQTDTIYWHVPTVTNGGVRRTRALPEQQFFRLTNP